MLATYELFITLLLCLHLPPVSGSILFPITLSTKKVSGQSSRTKHKPQTGHKQIMEYHKTYRKTKEYKNNVLHKVT